MLPKGKVPFLCAIVKSVTFSGTEGTVILKDPTGKLNSASWHKGLSILMVSV